MYRWTPRPALAVLLLLAYPLLTHAAVITGLDYLAWTAWLCIAALVVLSFPGRWGLAGFALLAAAPFVADTQALLKLPPVILNLALAVWFGRTLAPGEEPMIGWFARLVRGTELAPDLARYTRWSTVVWTVFFVGMAATAAALAVLATPQTWSLFANGIDYLLVGMLFVGEYLFRRLRYRHHEHRPLADVVRTVARAGRLAPRRTARHAPANSPWLAHRERGSRTALQFMKWLALRCGRGLAGSLLYPICAYFLLFSPRARRSSRFYLERALGRPARLADLWRHYFTFATTLLDRIYFIAGQFERFDIEVRGLDLLRRTLARRRGCILLGAHMGSFELMRTLAPEHQLPVNVVMYEENAANIAEVLNPLLDPALRTRIIVPGEVDTMLRIGECLARGEVVALLGDRCAGSEKAVMCRFFGREAAFPQGPLLLAHSLRVPVMLLAGLHEGGRRYVIYVEPFCDEPAGERAERAAWVREWAQRYAERLEHFCRLAPYNWFNFYDFWRESPG